MTLHCLRKAYGTTPANLGTPVHTVKDLMGHSSITTTIQYYVQSIDENKKKAVQELDKIMSLSDSGHGEAGD